MKRSATALGVLILVACTNPVASRSVSPPVRTETGDAPLVLTWADSERTSTSVVVRLDVDKRAPFEKDVDVKLVVPSGVSLEPSSTSWVIPASSVGTTSKSIQLRWSAVPAEDFVAVAEAQGVASGVRAVAAYRFSRGEPVSPEPARGPPAQVGDKSLGSPIDLAKP